MFSGATVTEDMKYYSIKILTFLARETSVFIPR